MIPEYRHRKNKRMPNEREAQMIRRYVHDGQTLTAIGQAFGVSRQRVTKILSRFDVIGSRS